VTALAAVALALNQVAGSPGGDVAESPERLCDGGWSQAVKVHRLLSCVGVPSGASFNESSVAAAVWWVAGWCASSVKSIVTSDASSLLYSQLKTITFTPPVRMSIVC